MYSLVHMPLSAPSPFSDLKRLCYSVWMRVQKEDTLYCSLIVPISKGSNTFHAFDVEREVWGLDIWSPPDQTKDEKYCCYWQV